MLEVGSLVDGKYRILDEVGRGGMSVVYLARNIRTNKQWAIKEVRKDGTNDFDIVRANLVAETDILKKLDHPNLPNIIDILDDGESFIIIMDFIEGNSLQHYIKHSGAQPEEDVVQWSIQLCDVLGYLHSRTPPIIYRDMKPANVMLKPDGNVSLIDFGTAREYKETSIEDTKCLGTQGYAAPEQYGGHGQTDARTDIYCLGATMYHLVTGHNPAEPPYEMYPIRYWNPELSQGLEQIILKCTQKNPEDRFQSCEELMYALQHREEMDEQVIRKQRRQLTSFLVSLLLTIVFAVGFFVLGSVRKNTIASTYEAEVASAKNLYEADPDIGLAEFQKAVQLAPERSEAYVELLGLLYSDNQFSTTDAVNIQSLLRGSNSNNGDLNETKFSAGNPESYAKFCFDLSLVYVLMYTGTDYNTPTTYLEVAMDSDYLSDYQREVAGWLYDMCKFLKSNNNKVVTFVSDVDETKTYAEYWEEIYNLVSDGNQMDITFEGMDIVQLKLLQFIVTSITTSARDFANENVSTDEMFEVLDIVESKIQTIISRNTDQAGFDELNTDSVNVDAARQQVQTVVDMQ
jgi:serine/threonine-protein kinase